MAAIELHGIDEMERHFADVNSQIRQRVAALLRHRSRFHGHTIDDWLEAERQLASAPVIEVRRDGNAVELVADIVGADPDSLDVDAKADHFVITTGTSHRRRTLMSIQLPATIDPATARAGFDDGVLIVRALVADREQPRLATVVHVNSGRLPEPESRR